MSKPQIFLYLAIKRYIPRVLEKSRKRNSERSVNKRTVSRYISRGLTKTGLGVSQQQRRGNRWQRGLAEEKLLDSAGK